MANDNTTPNSDNFIDLGKIKIEPKEERPLLVQADAQGNVIAPPPAEDILTPFPDGVLFRSSPNPVKPGTCIIHDGAGVPVALARTGEIADILCKGAHLFFQHAQAYLAGQNAKTPEPK